MFEKRPQKTRTERPAAGAKEDAVFKISETLQRLIKKAAADCAVTGAMSMELEGRQVQLYADEATYRQAIVAHEAAGQAFVAAGQVASAYYIVL